MSKSIENNCDFLDEQLAKVLPLKSAGISLSLDKLPLKTPAFNAKELALQLGVTEAIFKTGLNKFEEQNGFKFPRKGNNALDVNRSDAIEIMRFFEKKSISDLRDDDFEVPVLLIHDAKGGIGKSTVAETLATQSSFDLKNRPRTLLIDTDPQGSLRHKLAPKYTKPLHNLLRLLTTNVELSRDIRLSPEKQAEYKAILAEIIVTTHADDVSLLPSFGDCKHLNVYLAGALARGISKDQVISVYNDVIIEPLRSDFDLIIIDSNPATDMMLYTLYYAGTMLVIPVTGRQQDVNAYVEYLESVKVILSTMMPSDAKGFNDIITLITKNTKKPKSIYNRSLKIKTLARCFSTMIFESKVYEDASENNLPIQLMNHTSRNVRDSLEHASSLYEEIASLVFSQLQCEEE
ncbi:ParA family protein [Vibrio sp. 1180_3]|uniref:ParA family protein n=1 Tax=Vibrio sp. 1180_3 TaxID=2528832 RepID=UPI002404E6D0|nr:ParA family protein [Vibrio sp. 1180_3]MDF9399156.1 ParA family protein [Vibrio sp. 1180_3]